jgi:hypothetical protein
LKKSWDKNAHDAALFNKILFPRPKICLEPTQVIKRQNKGSKKKDAEAASKKETFYEGKWSIFMALNYFDVGNDIHEWVSV